MSYLQNLCVSSENWYFLRHTKFSVYDLLAVKPKGRTMMLLISAASATHTGWMLRILYKRLFSVLRRTFVWFTVRGQAEYHVRLLKHFEPVELFLVFLRLSLSNSINSVIMLISSDGTYKLLPSFSSPSRTLKYIRETGAIPVLTL